jgi:hypothetical protein
MQPCSMKPKFQRFRAAKIKVEDRLLAGLADGLSYKSACITAGIGVSTLADWREKYPELEVRMEEAREVARRGAFRKAFAHARGPCQGLSLKPYARAWH